MVGEGGFVLLVMDPALLHLTEILYGMLHFLSACFSSLLHFFSFYFHLGVSWKLDPLSVEVPSHP